MVHALLMIFLITLAGCESPQPACIEAGGDCVPVRVSSGAGQFGSLVSHRIGADYLEVNGYEPLKLHENTLNLLVKKGLITREEMQEVIRKSAPEKQIHLRQPEGK